MLQMIEETELVKGGVVLYKDLLKTGRTGIFMTESQTSLPNQHPKSLIFATL